MTGRPILAYSRPDIVAESNHRIANSLSMVAGLARMRAASMAGSPPRATIDLGEYLQDVSSAVVAAFSLDHPRLHFACEPDCCTTPESAVLIGLIVVELVTNSIKYAHPAGIAGEIAIVCSKDADGTITIEVSDDGVGLPEGFEPMTAASYGLRLVRSLAAELSASIGFPHNPLGLSCILQVPGKASGQ